MTQRTPNDREIADYLYGVCETRTEEYAIAEITKRLAIAREEGKQQGRHDMLRELRDELALPADFLQAAKDQT
jgi:hypothetical protein